MELISADEYYALPSEPVAKWLEIESICRDRVLEQIEEGSEEVAKLAQKIYVSTVQAAAEKLGIDINLSGSKPTSRLSFDAVISRVAGKVTELRLEGSLEENANEVVATDITREKIRDLIQDLRASVGKSDLDSVEKEKVDRVLEALLNEINRPRIRFGHVMALLSFIGAMTVGATTLLADAPDAISTITSLLGRDKYFEDAPQLVDQREKVLRLPAPVDT